jgi:hypothetical protein
VENTPDLMVVDNVVYGVRVLANLAITFNSTEDANQFKASYGGLGYSANAFFNYMEKHSSTTSSIHGYVVGGPSNSVVTFDPKTLLAGINKILEGVNYENARPVSYEFMDMAGDVVGSQSATDSFKVRECAPATTNPRVTSIRVDFLSGRDGKDWDTNVNMYLYSPNFVPDNAQDDMVGAEYGYQSRSHSIAFGGGQENDVYLIPGNGVLPGPMLKRDDINRGGRIRLHIYPNGNDTWDVQKATIYFNFEDGSSNHVEIPPFVVSQTVTVYDMVIKAGQMTP